MNFPTYGFRLGVHRSRRSLRPLRAAAQILLPVALAGLFCTTTVARQQSTATPTPTPTSTPAAQAGAADAASAASAASAGAAAAKAGTAASPGTKATTENRAADTAAAQNPSVVCENKTGAEPTYDELLKISPLDRTGSRGEPHEILASGEQCENCGLYSDGPQGAGAVPLAVGGNRG